MKVIKDNSKKRIICPSCDSILEYDHKDVKNINGVKTYTVLYVTQIYKFQEKRKRKNQKINLRK